MMTCVNGRTPRPRVGMLVGALLLAAFSPPARADDPDNCLLCHQYRGLSRYAPEEDAVHLYFVSVDYQQQHRGAHARIACTDCHERSEVGVIPHLPVSRVDCTRTCHLRNPGGVARTFSHADVAHALSFSVHNAETFSKVRFQGGRLLRDGQSQCLYCHDEPVFRQPTDVLAHVAVTAGHALDRCDTCHQSQVPTDVNYYLWHVTSRLQRARPPLEMAQACAVCHSDAQVLADFGLRDAGVHYASTFHGKAALLGSRETADCIGCHIREGSNSHNILAQTDPLSISHPDNRADACRSSKCHPGADPSIGRAAVHLDLPTLGGLEMILAVAFVIFTLLTFGPSLILTVLELFQVVVGRHVEEERHMHDLAEKVLRHPDGRSMLRRFTAAQRWQHWLLAFIFALLVATGFPMKFASQPWARNVIDAFGGLGQARTVHHWAGVALVVGFGLHLLNALWRAWRHARQRGPGGRRVGVVQAAMSMPMFVGPQDLKKAGQLMGYLLFLRKKPPRFGRFSLDQKFEYLGVFWGTVLLGVTGAILWDPTFTSHYITGRVFNLALIAHTYEAFLAVIHVGILHICNVVFAPQVFPFSPATLTGDTPVTRLSEVHGEQVLDAARRLGIAIPPEVEHAG